MTRLAQTSVVLILGSLLGSLVFLFIFSAQPVRTIFAQSGPADERPPGPGCGSGCGTDVAQPNSPTIGTISSPNVLDSSWPAGNYYDVSCGCVINWSSAGDNGGGDGGGGDGGGGNPGPAPSCTVDLVPASSSVSVGSSTPLVASMIATSDGNIDQVQFSSNNGDATVSPNSDSSSPYGTSATGASIGTSTITASVFMSNSDHSSASTCSDTASVQVTNPPGWWQTKDSDVWSRGDISSIIPGTCSGACTNKFSLDGAGGFPGVIVYNGSANFGSGSVSSKGWQANSGYGGTPYNYTWFESKIPTGTTVSPITDSTISGGTLVSSAASTGYTYFKRTGDLTITSNANLNNKKVILFVTGNLTIQGRVNLNKGNGFFMTIVGGNINIDPSVTHPSQPSLEGAYFANGNISTGTGGSSNDGQLYIRGSIAAGGSINLQRDLGSNNQTKPAELIEFAPDLIFTYPSDLGSKNFIWHEVAP